jgi:hypothetical protein
MKKQLLFGALIMGLTNLSFSQTDLPNPDFEVWSDEVYWEDPMPFTTTNLQAYLSSNSGNANKTSDSHGGLYGCELITTDNELGTLPGALFIGTPSTDLIEGGLPFDGSPDSIKFFAKHHIAEGDSAVMYCILQGSGLPIALGFQSVTGEETDWVEYTAPMDYLFAMAPDIVSLIFASSDFENPNPESWIIVDDIQFVYNGVEADPFPGGDFEEWVEVASAEPDMWNTSNPFTSPLGQSVQESNQAYSGSRAARIESLPTAFGEGDNIGFVINGQLGDDEIIGGLPLSGNEIPTSLTGYYKYDPAELTDSAGVLILLRKYNDLTMEYDTLIEGELDLPAAATYTLFEIELPESILNEWISEGTYPDLLTIGFSSSKIDPDDEYISPEGSVLWIDALELSYYVGVNELNDEENLLVYPNPSSEKVQFQNLDFSKIRSLKLIDASGVCVRDMTQIKSGAFNPNLTLDVSSLPCGTYTMVITSEDGIITKQISVIH